MASFMRKPCILVILVPLAEFIFLAPNVSGFVPYRFGRISVRCTRQSMQVQSEWGFALERVLQAADDAWERRKTGERYKKVLDPEWSIDVSKAGRIDFLGIGSGKDAWEAFAKDHATDMHNSTRARLERPHFLIAETGLTGKTLMRKFKEDRTTLKFMQDVVSSLQSKNINAVKCLVYDAVDAEGLATSEAAAKFLNESGILISIPYLTAETVLGKFDEIGKAREELRELRELLSLISGAAETQTKVVWVRQLRQDDGEIKEADTDPFKIKESVADVDDLKKAIKKKAELTIASFLIQVWSLKDGRWEKEDVDAGINRGTSMSDCYGYLLPS